jgi:hypothetical protein
MLEWIKQTFNAIFGSSNSKNVENFDIAYKVTQEINDFHSSKPQPIDGNQEMAGLLVKLDAADE